MLCKSCSSEINPQWKYATTSNICPFCGQSIMDEKLTTLLLSLRETLDSLKEYQGELDDWILSNYNFIKTDSPNLISFLPENVLKELKAKKVEEAKKSVIKVKTETGEQEVSVEKTQSEESTNDFFKRSEAVRPNIDGFKSVAEKTKHLKEAVAKIKKEGNPMLMISSEQSEESAEMQQYINQESANSALMPPDGDDEIPGVVLAMANQAKGKNPTSTNASDLIKLQMLQDRTRNSKQNFESGENRGKGGFSRSG